MNKFMIAAAAAAMIGGAQADVILPGVCDPTTEGCAPMVFKLTGSGKVSMNVAAGYKSVQSLSIKKGFIIAKRDDVTTPVYETVEGFKGFRATAVSEWTIESVPVDATNGTSYAIQFPTTVKIEKVTEAESKNGAALAKKINEQNKASKEVEVWLYGGGNVTNKSYAAKVKWTGTSSEEIISYHLTADSWQVQTGTKKTGCATCYENADVYAQVKAGKSTWNVAYIDCAIAKWSVFGKNYEKYMDDVAEYNADPLYGFSDKLESELVIYTEDALNDAEHDIDSAIYFAGFGSYEIANKKASTGKNLCVGGKCTSELSQKLTYNGWFIGGYTGDCDEACFTCDCPYGFVFGGTWKAVYDAKATGDFDADYIFE